MTASLPLKGTTYYKGSDIACPSDLSGHKVLFNFLPGTQKEEQVINPGSPSPQLLHSEAHISYGHSSGHHTMTRKRHLVYSSQYAGLLFSQTSIQPTEDFCSSGWSQHFQYRLLLFQLTTACWVFPRFFSVTVALLRYSLSTTGY